MLTSAPSGVAVLQTGAGTVREGGWGRREEEEEERGGGGGWMKEGGLKGEKGVWRKIVNCRLTPQRNILLTL